MNDITQTRSAKPARCRYDGFLALPGEAICFGCWSAAVSERDEGPSQAQEPASPETTATRMQLA